VHFSLQYTLRQTEEKIYGNKAAPVPEKENRSDGIHCLGTRIFLQKGGTAMPQPGDTMTAYCGKCERETTWLYCIFMFGKDIWECKECGARRYS
jgi:hypothetical protein